MEISCTLNSVAPITSASTRFSISIITGSAYNLGRVQVYHQTFQALALSVNSRPGRSGNEIGRVGIPIDHSPTDSWERVFGNLAEMTWELQTIENGLIRWCLIFTLDCERGWVDLLLFFCCWDSCWAVEKTIHPVCSTEFNALVIKTVLMCFQGGGPCESRLWFWRSRSSKNCNLSWFTHPTPYDILSSVEHRKRSSDCADCSFSHVYK